MFKAAELINALIQIRERNQASDRLGPALALSAAQCLVLNVHLTDAIDR